MGGLAVSPVRLAFGSWYGGLVVSPGVVLVEESA